MSTTRKVSVEQLTLPTSKRGLVDAAKRPSSRSSQHDGHERVKYETQIGKIVKSIADTGKGHREAMYRGAAECAVMAHQIASNIGIAGELFGGMLKKHWERKKQHTSAIYQFLIQSAFVDPKQASKVFTSTRAMFEKNTSSDKFVSRLKEHGGFDGLRKREAARRGPSESASGEDKDGKGNKGSDANVVDTHAQKLLSAGIDPRHPKITALYSRKFRSKIEGLALNDELRIKATVWDAKKNGPLIRIISIELCSDRDNRTNSK